MAIAHSQVFTFRNLISPHDGDVANDRKARIMWGEFKAAMKAGGWTVVGSYAGTGSLYNDGTANPLVAGTDSWLVPADELPLESNRAWMILQCPPIMGKLQIMFWQLYNGVSNNEYIVVRSSPGGEFMASGGGTDGTTTTPPTAPDEITHIDGNQQTFQENSPYTCQCYTAWSADLSQFYMFLMQEAANPMFFCASVLENPDPDLENGLAWCWSQVSGSGNTVYYNSQMDNGSHYTTPSWNGVINGVSRTFYLGGRGWNNAGVQLKTRIQADGKCPPGPAELYNGELTERGFVGRVPDIYWTATQYNKGYGDAVAGPIKWYSHADFVIPWDVNQPLPRQR